MDINMYKICVLLLTIYGLTRAQRVRVPTVAVHPTELIVREGDPIEFVCRSDQPIVTCRIDLPTGQGISLQSSSQNTEIGLEYFGDGFEAGQCGLKLLKAEAQYNGQFRCTMAVSTSIYEAQGTIRVTVAKPPDFPAIKVWNKYQDFNEHDILDATCYVPNGRPAANVTWYMGDEVITSGLQPPMIYPENPQMADVLTFAQNLSRSVTWRDHGKKLRCVAQHIGNVGNKETDYEIKVRFPPLPSEHTPIELYGFEEGREGVITYIVKANPPPTMEWTVNGRDIVEGQSTDEYEVETATQLESGQWEARLRIKRVSNSDINKDFRLRATNELGNQIYTIKISTQPAAQAAGLASWLVAIIAIVVLLIFVGIFVGIFIFRTKRGCFADSKNRAGSEAHIDPEAPAKAGNENLANTEDHEPELIPATTNGVKVNAGGPAPMRGDKESSQALLMNMRRVLEKLNYKKVNVNEDHNPSETAVDTSHSKSVYPAIIEGSDIIPSESVRTHATVHSSPPFNESQTNKPQTATVTPTPRRNFKSDSSPSAPDKDPTILKYETEPNFSTPVRHSKPLPKLPPTATVTASRQIPSEPSSNSPTPVGHSKPLPKLPPTATATAPRNISSETPLSSPTTVGPSKPPRILSFAPTITATQNIPSEIPPSSTTPVEYPKPLPKLTPSVSKNVSSESPLKLNTKKPLPKLPPSAKSKIPTHTSTVLETDLDADIHQTKSAGALHSSDTESAEHAQADEPADKKKWSKPFSFLHKKPEKTASKQITMEEGKMEQPDEKKNDVEYAELDLATTRKPGEIPTIRREDDKTVYAEIRHPRPI